MKSPCRGELHSQSPLSLVKMLGKHPGSSVSIPLLQPPGKLLHPKLPFTRQVQPQYLQDGVQASTDGLWSHHSLFSHPGFSRELHFSLDPVSARVYSVFPFPKHCCNHFCPDLSHFSNVSWVSSLLNRLDTGKWDYPT